VSGSSEADGDVSGSSEADGDVSGSSEADGDITGAVADRDVLGAAADGEDDKEGEANGGVTEETFQTEDLERKCTGNITYLSHFFPFLAICGGRRASGRAHIVRDVFVCAHIIHENCLSHTVNI
jgi:hypothetical protein